MSKVGFVILHYCTIDMTKKCVEAITEKIKDTPWEIIIVDNASGNGTGKQLFDFYQGREHITVILSEANLGFAKGNNLGYCYAKAQLGCDFVCVMNNDVMILQEDFASNLISIYEKEPYAVLGPHITLLNDKENAMYYQLSSVEQLEKERNGYIRRLKRQKSRIYKFWNMWELAKLRLRIFLGKIHVMEELKLHEDCIEGAHEKQTNLVLHGCCLIFSPMYALHYKEAFDPETFMFREEEILYLRCKKTGIPMHYDPTLNILHMEDVATNFVYKTERNKEIFHLENQIESLGILIRKIKEIQVEQ